MRMTTEEFRAYEQKRAPKTPKYRNVKKAVNGLEFDSTKEARRYQDLVLMQQAGQIWELERQKEFELTVNKILICTYVCDFAYKTGRGHLTTIATARQVVEDVKSKATRKLPVYAIKKKLMRALYGIEIQEI